MSSYYTEVVQLGKIEKHPNADTLSLTEVFGNTVIFKAGAYQEGDLVGYVSEDAIMPDLPEFDFLKHKRIKAMKLRGIFSQGLLFELSTKRYWNQGDDVSEFYGITKYDPEAALEKGLTNQGLAGPAPKLPVLKYDLDSLNKYSANFIRGETVVISEKIHGCVPVNARIQMADGTRLPLNKIRVGDYVLGVDEVGNPCSSRVIRKFNNGPAIDGWLRISGQRRNAGRGNSFFALNCTPDHKIWCVQQNKYIPAKELHPGDRILSARTDLALSPLQLPERYRGHSGWLPPEDSEFKSMLVEQIVDSITVDNVTNSYRYDMETETHNYFAYGVLVHNCNARFVYHDGKFWAGSRQLWREDLPGDVWWAVARQYNLEEKLKQYPDTVFYGEVFGQVQDLKYNGGLNLAFFDIYETHKTSFLSYGEFVFTCNWLGLPIVPELFRGPWVDKETIKFLAEGKSTVKDANCIREGIVVRPMQERTTKFGRVVLKLHGEGFLLRK